MTSKNVKIITFLTVILLAIMVTGAVSAIDNTNSTISTDNTQSADVTVKNVETTQITDDTQEAVANDYTITKNSDKAALKTAKTPDEVAWDVDSEEDLKLDYIEDNTNSYSKILNLNAGETYTTTGTAIFSSETNDICTSLTINGNGAIIDGEGARSFLAIAEGYTVTLNDLTIKNMVGDYGGAITNNGTLIINNVEFDSNNATYQGGAIYSQGTLTVTNSEFTNNRMITHQAAGHNDYGGGAICALDKLTVDGCVFDSNLAAHNDVEPNGDGGVAGAILLFNNNKDITITNSNFTKNSGRHGGAITVETGDDATVLIKSNNFVENDALYGAAIDTYNAITVTENNFTRNVVDGQGSGDRVPMGGAICLNGEGYTATITNNKFTENTATENGEGGAVFSMPNTEMISSENTFENNHADDFGGAIYNQGTLTSTDDKYTGNTAAYAAAVMNFDSFTSEGNVYEENEASQMAGAVYNYYGEFTSTDDTYTQNTASQTGAIQNVAGETTITGGTFTENTADAVGAIFNTGELTITGTTFTDNYDTGGFGDLIYTTTDVTLEDVTIDADDLSDVVALRDGATIDSTDLTLNGINVAETDLETYIISNIDDYQALYDLVEAVKESGITYVVTANLTGTNYQEIEGETLVIDEDFLGSFIINGNAKTIDANHMQFMTIAEDNIVTIKNLTVINAEAEKGAAIYDEGTLTVMDSVFRNNKATKFGGAIYVHKNVDAELTVTNSVFEENTANVAGAIFANLKSTAIITSSNFTNNKAETGSETGDAGAIYANDATLTIDDCKFTLNTADVYGGAISVYNSTDVTITDSSFTQNTADINGGAIWTNSTITISNSNFTENTATENGGALYNYGGDLTSTGNKFIENTATEYYGGAIYNYGGTLTSNGNLYTDNQASSGGALYNSFAGPNDITVSVENDLYDGNKATGQYIANGGAIWTNINLTVKSSNFTDNSAIQGGAVYTAASMYDYSLVIEKSKFDDNTATENGGAVYTSYNTTITDSNFTQNNADMNGGAVYIIPGDATIFFVPDYQVNISINDSKFDSNTAGDGAAIYVTSKTSFDETDTYLNVNNTVFNENIATESGGAIYNDYGQVTLTSNTFTEDEAATGAEIYSNYDLTMNNNLLVNNKIGFEEFMENTTVTQGANNNFYTNKTTSVTDDNGFEVETTLDKVVEVSDRTTGAIIVYINEEESEVYYTKDEDTAKFTISFTTEDITEPSDVVVLYGNTIDIGNEYSAVEFNLYQNYTTITLDEEEISVYPLTNAILTGTVTNFDGEEVTTGTVTVIIDDLSYTSEVTDGTFEIELPTNHIIVSESFTVEYTDDSLAYKSSEAEFTYEVVEYSGSLVIDPYYEDEAYVDEEVTFSFSIEDEEGDLLDINGKLELYVIVGDEEIPVNTTTLTNGTATIGFTAATADEWNLIARFTNDTMDELEIGYAIVEKRFTFTSNKIPVMIFVFDSEGTVNKETTITANIADVDDIPIDNADGVIFKYKGLSDDDWTEIDEPITFDENTGDVTVTHVFDKVGEYPITVVLNSNKYEATTIIDNLVIILQKAEIIVDEPVIYVDAYDDIEIEFIVESDDSPVEEGIVTLKVVSEDGTPQIGVPDETLDLSEENYMFTIDGGLAAGTYYYNLSYASDNYIVADNVTVKVVVSPKEAVLSMVEDNVYAYPGEEVIIEVFVTDLDENDVNYGTVVITRDDGEVVGEAEVSEGVALIQYTPTIDDLGDYELTVTYQDSSYQAEDYTDALLIVEQVSIYADVNEAEGYIGLPVIITASIDTGDDETMPEGLEVRFVIGDEEIGTDIIDEDGSAGIMYTPTETGEFEVSLEFIDLPDKYVIDSINPNTMVITAIPATIEVDPASTETLIGKSVDVDITITPDIDADDISEGYIIVKDSQGNPIERLEVEDGMIPTITIPATTLGLNIYTVSYESTGNYEASDVTFEIMVNSIDTTVEFEAIPDLTLGETVDITVTVTADDNSIVNDGTVTFTDKDGNPLGQEYIIDVVDGKATITYTANKVGITKIVAKYSDSESYSENEATTSLKVAKAATTLTVDPVTATVGQTVTLTARVENANDYLTIDEGKVVFKINGKTIKGDDGKVIYVKVEDGIATLEYEVPESWADKEIIISAVFSGSTNYNSSKGEANVEIVTKNPSFTITSDATFTKDTVKTFTVELKDGDTPIYEGRVVFKINGKTLKDDKGKVIYVDVVDGIASLDFNINATYYKSSSWTLKAVFISTEYERMEATQELQLAD